MIQTLACVNNSSSAVTHKYIHTYCTYIHTYLIENMAHVNGMNYFCAGYNPTARFDEHGPLLIHREERGSIEGGSGHTTLASYSDPQV